MRKIRSRYGKNRTAKKLLIFFLLAAILCLLSLGLNFWVYQEIQKRLGIHAQGQYVPYLFIPSFELRQGRFSWKERFQLIDGNFKVTFDPLSLVTRQGIRIIIQAKNSSIRFLGDWAVQQGIENALVDSMVADFFLGRRGLSGINEIEVKSQSFQFSFRNADKKIVK